jgi:hypothetical protein
MWSNSECWPCRKRRGLRAFCEGREEVDDADVLRLLEAAFQLVLHHGHELAVGQHPVAVLVEYCELEKEMRNFRLSSYKLNYKLDTFEYVILGNLRSHILHLHISGFVKKTSGCLIGHGCGIYE